MSIEGKNRDIRQVIGKLAQVTISILKNELGIEGYTDDRKYTGVFVNGKKVTAIGIAVNNRVTMHGFAMNVNTDLSHFDWIVPCGLKDRGVTSMEQLAGQTQNLEKIKRLICTEFELLFENNVYEVSKESLYNTLGDDVYETRMVENKRVIN